MSCNGFEIFCDMHKECCDCEFYSDGVIVNCKDAFNKKYGGEYSLHKKLDIIEQKLDRVLDFLNKQDKLISFNEFCDNRGCSDCKFNVDGIMCQVLLDSKLYIEKGENNA